ncbi:type VI secretion system baseplate subunit TssF [Ancylobacter amanitiformis]|uniref:Type VI secretion system protein ImpG n=1 Tax=Ancylobacter amanitiformis TaxID=217069 RepID=A0ABU0LLA4_9HYPH|nr:type VI secretion system baseplate subunit TssF [Ancylobacter amanitiformis]MDQ0509447.1 type VI secretion system protein ImpG [Ancylobacter amanitiformis]
MALNRYYEDELAYLRDLGDMFARENPKLAGFLSRKASDPDVERLLEGFAFLTANLRQRLDDDLPELVHGLLRLVWPAYLRPIPPTTTLCFHQVGGGDGAPICVPRGTEVRSRPLDGTTCPFMTCYPLDVLPLDITRVDLENTATAAELSTTLSALRQAGFSALADRPLRLHFSADRDPLVGRTLYLWMQRHLRRIVVRAGDETLLTLPPGAVSPVGFSVDEAVLAQEQNAVEGFRLLQEYLLLPQKYLYVDISGLAPVAATTARTLELVFVFDRPLPPQVRVSREAVRVNCTPAVNLFPAAGTPIHVDVAKTEYRVSPLDGDPLSIHAVTQVAGFVQGSSQRIDYVPFESFRHDLPGHGGGAYYRARITPSVVGRRIDHYISFVNALDRRVLPAAETVSIELTCSSGRLAERLPVGSIDQPGMNTPNGLAFENIAQVTGEVAPPLEDGLLWRLVASLACNFNSIADVGTFKQLIATFDFRAVPDEQARRRLELLLDGLERFEHGTGDMVMRGVPVRIRHYTLVCQESKVGGEAEMFLFGCVVERMLSAFATVNSMHQFAIRGSETNVRYEWPPRRGTAQPL